MWKNFLLRLQAWILGFPAYVQKDKVEEPGLVAIYDGKGKLVRFEHPDEFGLVSSDYERAGVALPKRTQQAALHYNHPDGRHASLLVYDHEIDLLFDAINENRRKRRIP